MAPLPLQVFEGVIQQVETHQKVIKIKIDSHPNAEFLYFKSDPETTTSLHVVKNRPQDIVKDKHIPLFFKGSFIKATCGNYAGSWAIKEVTISPPCTYLNAVIWTQELVRWLTTLKDYRKKTNVDPQTITLTHLGTLFMQNIAILRHAIKQVLDEFKDENNQDILRALINNINFPSDASQLQLQILLILIKMVEVYDRVAMFHRIKADVQKHGFDKRITDQDCMKILEFCGANYMEFVKNPYLVYRKKKKSKASFAVLDLFAEMYGIDLPKRISNNVWHTVQTITNEDGHTWVETDYAVRSTTSSMKLRGTKDVTEDLVRKVIHDEVPKKFIFAGPNNNRLYLSYVYAMENDLAERVTHFVEHAHAHGEPYVIADERIESLIVQFEKENSLQLHPLQKTAIKEYYRTDTNLHVLTGLPGSGKSSVVKCVKFMANELGIANVVTCAPTGKAASRLGDGAKTIHRALHTIHNEETDDFEFVHNESNPLDVDMMIVDEVSMLDLKLASDLFKALPTEKPVRILLLGDENQLPSVKYGDVLRSLLESQVVPHTHLTKIYRQGDGSIISKVAKCIIKGTAIPARYTVNNKEVIHINESDPRAIHKTVLQLYVKHARKGNSVIILDPTKKGEVGTHAINNTIHRFMFKEDANLEKINKLRETERVICTTNYYVKEEDSAEIILEKCMFNGDCGILKSHLSGSRCKVLTTPDNREVEVPNDILEMGYCLSVHKSQGSEYDVVIMILHDSHSIMLNKEVFYTGVTRAKHILYIIGTEVCIDKAVRYKCKRRNTGLAEMIAGHFEMDQQS